MKNKKLLLWTATFGCAVIVAAMINSTLLMTPAGAAGCGPCTGSIRSAEGNGSDTNVTLAYNEAYQDALLEAWDDAPACVPCQINVSNVVWGVSTPSCSGPAPFPKPFYTVNLTLEYLCQSCSIEDPDTPN